MSNLFSGFSNTGVPIPTIEEVEQATRNPTDNVQIAASIQQSAQEFPPAINTGAFFAQTVRGPILPPYGTKGRDKTLRLIYRNDYNSLVQGVVSAIVKKFITTPWDIQGDEKIKVTIRGADGRLKTISAIEHYQLVFQNAQFGMGWEFFCQQFLEDFFCQDFGAVCELIGPGEPIGPVDGAITGIAHLDSGRCYITGNPYYPIFYWSLISGSLHRMHASRIVRFVDAPSPDERFFGIGLCALSRAIAISNRQMLMTRYIEGLVDDKPKPGITTWQGLTQPQVNNLMAGYLRDLQNDALPSWGKNINVASVNIDNPIKVESIPFAQTPEKYNWIEYNSLDVDAIALAFGIDRQDIWELAGRSLGSAMQSQVLADKAAGKMIGFLFQNFERMINRRILPREFEFQFKRKDAEAESKQAAINLQLAQTVAALAAVPGTLSPQEGRDFLSNSSDSFKDILTNKAGQVTAQDASESEQVSLEDANPIDISQTPQAPAPVAPAKPPTPPQAPPSTNGNKPPVQKEIKFNPNHDSESGQFAEGSGGGNGSRSPSGSTNHKPKPSVGSRKPSVQHDPTDTTDWSSDPNRPHEIIQEGAYTDYGGMTSDYAQQGSSYLSKAATKHVTPQQKAAISEYTGGGLYRDINDYYRGKSSSLSPEAQANVDHLDKAIGQASLPQGAVLYRGLHVTPEQIKQFKPGASFSDPGFSSSSFSQSASQSYLDKGGSGGVMMRIKAPKGSKVLPVEAVSDYPEEKEVILPRGQKFTVTRVKKGAGGRLFVDVQLEAA